MRKTKLRLLDERVMVKGEPYYLVKFPKPDGHGGRRFFKKKGDAETFVKLKKTEIENHGTAAGALNESARAEYLESCEALKPFGLSLREAIQMLLPQLQAQNRTCKVKVLVAELLRVKTADGASKRYLEDLDSRLNQFSAVYGERAVAGMAGTEIDGWLRSLPVAPTTRNNFRRVLVVAFNFGLKNGYCITNPAEASAKAKEIDAAPGILKPEELANLLSNADESLLPFVAIGAFAGLRRAELERLDWSEVDLQGGYIEVTAAKAKSARRRLVKIRENLAAWLQPYGKHTGAVAPKDCRKLMDAAKRAIGFGTPGTETEDEKKAKVELKPWPDNALRHSFASYHLAHFKDQSALALEMGHTNTVLVFNHYRELVKPKDAERYWSIKPASADNIRTMTAAA
ncbi:MAG: site-specific integrase [Verrucomicrobiota bacterium]